MPHGDGLLRRNGGAHAELRPLRGARHGCGPFDAFYRVVLPLALPGLIAAGILAFVFSWNEFPIALSLTSRDNATVPVAIARFAQQYEIQHAQMAAASVISTIPAILLMFVGQRFIISGLTLGAVK